MLSIIGVTPHPPIIIPEIGRDELKKAAGTVKGMNRLCEEIRAAGPELVIVITPHGRAAPEGPVVPTAERLGGDFGRFGFPGLRLTMHTDRRLVELLAEETAAEPLRPVFAGAGDRRFRSEEALDHGALVPLYYLQRTGSAVAGMHVTIGFQPYRELYAFGRALGRAVERRGAKTAVLASGDLSHRLIPGAPAGFSPRGQEFDHLLVELLRDKRVEEILNLDSHLVEEAGECGLRSFIIALGMLDGHDFQPEIISYEGPFGVGYLVAALRPRPGEIPGRPGGEGKGKDLSAVGAGPAALARQAIERHLGVGRSPAGGEDLAPGYPARAGVFVSIKKQGRLRGCIGTFEPLRDSLAGEIAANAVSAAENDPRFPLLGKSELPEIDISVDILGPLERVGSEAELDPRKYGVLVQSGPRRGLLLPALEGVDSAAEQVAVARRKGGIGPTETVELYRFTVTRCVER